MHRINSEIREGHKHSQEVKAVEEVNLIVSPINNPK
jgi:hypothetical protein